MTWRNLVRLVVVLYLVFPFIFLSVNFPMNAWPEFQEVFWAFKNSFIQAFLSALLSVSIGFWIAMGLLTFSEGYRRRYRTLLELLCLAPSFLPPIFSLLALLNIIDPFPMGIFGIVIAHTAINFGLVAVVIASLVENKIGTFAELAYIEGASRLQFFRHVFWPLMKRELFLIGLFVFAVCFGGFAVPLIVGGGSGTTIEVLIYEKIRLSSNWSQAVVLACLQSVFIFVISMAARRGGAYGQFKNGNFRIMRMWSGVGILLVLSFLGFFGYIQGLMDGFKQIVSFYEIQSALIWNFFGTLLMGLLVGGISLTSLLVVAYCWPSRWFEKFLSGYMAPSTALCCFSFLVIAPNESFWPFIKIPIVFNLLCFGSLYRMGWDGHLRALEPQIQTARVLGANPSMIFKDIIVPQVASRGALLAGVASVWVCGDYAVSRILAHRDVTLAMMSETLLSTYRLGLATVLSLSLIFCGVVCFLIMMGVGRVLSRKSI